ncbi:site-specific recombinase PinR [Mycobacteroides abscessus subsp. bolletii]|nr:site-specific recombinase PinR [Mycobacteroides abscessus subsp. bolletii]SIA41355.1 site-specific recombinase PinR [Mycobacteroides abscessus subsp. bolletii]
MSFGQSMCQTKELRRCPDNKNGNNNSQVIMSQIGYARVSTGRQSLDQQVDALTAAGVDESRVYSDKLSGTSTREQRPGLAALLDYVREGDVIVVVGIDRLGRNAAEVMTTIRELSQRGIVLRSLREGVDTWNAASRMSAGVLASLAELELELGREYRTAGREARKARGQAHRTSRSSGRSEGFTGPANARDRRTCHHHRLNPGRQPGHRLPSAGPRQRVLTATP